MDLRTIRFAFNALIQPVSHQAAVTLLGLLAARDSRHRMQAQQKLYRCFNVWRQTPNGLISIENLRYSPISSNEESLIEQEATFLGLDVSDDEGCLDLSHLNTIKIKVAPDFDHSSRPDAKSRKFAKVLLGVLDKRTRRIQLEVLMDMF